MLIAFPVLPLLASTMLSPGRSSPSRSARSIMYFAMRALIDPEGLRYSSLTHIPSTVTRGVSPIASKIVPLAFMPAPSIAGHQAAGPCSVDHFPEDARQCRCTASGGRSPDPTSLASTVKLAAVSPVTGTPSASVTDTIRGSPLLLPGVARSTSPAPWDAPVAAVPCASTTSRATIASRVTGPYALVCPSPARHTADLRPGRFRHTNRRLAAAYARRHDHSADGQRRHRRRRPRCRR